MTIKQLIGCNIIAIAFAASISHGQTASSPKFFDVAKERLKKVYGVEIETICPIGSDTVAARVFSEYGAVFVSHGIKLPTKCVYDNDAELETMQQAIGPRIESIGGVNVTLQKPAMEALLAARAEARKAGLDITPRGGAGASTRSYSNTVTNWKSRFEPALNHWVSRGRIPAADAERARRASIREQVAMVLAWEKQELWFSTGLNKSILYSVAAPGASQHNFMLALDVAQFGDAKVREILARHGWFQTVKSDLPHFTYLGVDESRLPALGLKEVYAEGRKFWVPNID